LKRTVEELLIGTDAFLPLSEYELAEWNALLQIEHAEREEALAKAKRK